MSVRGGYGLLFTWIIDKRDDSNENAWKGDLQSSAHWWVIIFVSDVAAASFRASVIRASSFKIFIRAIAYTMCELWIIEIARS